MCWDETKINNISGNNQYLNKLLTKSLLKEKNYQLKATKRETVKKVNESIFFEN